MNTKPQIIIVDDDQQTRQVARMMFSGLDFDFLEADSGSAMLEMLVHGKRPDVILLDIMMPDMDGFQVLEAIRDFPEPPGSKIMMLTARSDLKDKIRAFSLGAVDYIEKPFIKDELIARIGTQVKVKRYEEHLVSSQKVLEERAVLLQAGIQNEKRKTSALIEEQEKLEKLVAEQTADLTQTNQRLQRLVENLTSLEARYRSHFENSPISIWEEDFSEIRKVIDWLHVKKDHGLSFISVISSRGD